MLWGDILEYTVQKLALLAGVSTRTLRFYDEQGLLKPLRISTNGYRIYGQAQVDLLQQILFFRELGVGLDEIKAIINAPGFKADASLENHLLKLENKREQLDMLIANVRKTIKMRKEGTNMSDKEKFEGFKKNLLDENEKKYGAEVREKYGADTIEKSNKAFANMSEETYNRATKLAEDIIATLLAAMDEGDPAGETAQKACALHKEWLTIYWGQYNKEAHRGLGQMYVDDERFTAYYDKARKGAAVFLRDALNVFTA